MVDTYQPPVMPAPAVSPERMVWAYAGFWWRVLAWGIDWFILAVAQTLINLATGLTPFGITSTTTSTGRDISNVVDIRIAYADSAVIAPVQWMPSHMHVHGLPLTLISILVMAAYFVLLESSRWQGTLGKKVCRLRVTDAHGRRSRSPGRSAAISVNTCRRSSWGSAS